MESCGLMNGRIGEALGCLLGRRRVERCEREKHLFFAEPPTMDEIMGVMHPILAKL